ncbi:MAG: B12-binding domain-containing radical SAM protein [Blastocatellia bacterium]|nr:B12-binding domain-containing radical SAM protein [Blastocatellia bacterium]
MKVLLIYPEFPDTYWSFKHALSFTGKRSAFPPLGLLTVSAMLPASWEKRLVDMNVKQLTKADIQWADMVFASAMLVQKDSLNSVIGLCKSYGKRVVLGGPYVTTTDVPAADHVFIGEVESTFPEFVQDIQSGDTKRVYQAVQRPSMALSPIPDFKLADLKRYSSMSIQYSRGCPFQCEFCDIIEIYGRVPRTKTNEQMIAELNELFSIGWRGKVFIVDDNFIGNKQNVKQLMPALIEWSQQHNYPFTFITEASVNIADESELLDQMRRAGFNQVFLGIETPVEDSLKEARKGQNTRRNLVDSVKKIQSYGLEVMAGFIVGFDNDPIDIFERQINFIRESAIPLAMVGLLAALPGTQLWHRLDREGRLLKQSSGNNTDASLNFITKMDSNLLLEGYKSILKNIYSSKEYYRRVLDYLERSGKSFNGEESESTSLWKNLIALIKLLFTLGIKDKEREEFWHFMYEIFTKHRKNLGYGLTRAAMGYHFRKLTDQYCR